MNLHSDSLWIGTLLRQRLEEIAPVYPLVAEYGAPEAYIVYRRFAYSPRPTKDGYNATETMTMEISAVAPNYDQSLEMAEDVRKRLEGARGWWEGKKVSLITMSSASEAWRDPVYVQTLAFNITIDN